MIVTWVTESSENVCSQYQPLSDERELMLTLNFSLYFLKLLPFVFMAKVCNHLESF